MPLNVQPNPLVASVSLVQAETAASYVHAVATLAYTRLYAEVLVIGEAIGARFVDFELMVDAPAFSVRKALADAEVMTDLATVSFFSGSEVDGAEINGVVMNG
jgi:hypothetical protein